MKDVEIRRPDKLLWSGITKQAYADYLGAVAASMLPWVRERPLTLVRAPDGIEGKRYFQKDTPAYAPDWIPTVSIAAPSAGRDVRYVVCNDASTLRWLGNQAALEFHPAPVSRCAAIASTCWSSTSTHPTTRSMPQWRWPVW